MNTRNAFPTSILVYGTKILAFAFLISATVYNSGAKAEALGSIQVDAREVDAKASRALETAQHARDAADTAKQKVEEVEDQLRKRAAVEFAGLHFGVGIGFTQTFGRDRIESAINDNGIVRIEGETNAIPRVLLESHYFLTPNQWHDLFCKYTFEDDNKSKIGIGPFVALQPGTGQIIQAIAFGVMVGLKDPIYKDTSHSWNMGFGVSLEPSSTTLGDGLVANQPVPVGATIRTQTRSLVGFTALLSYGW